MAVILRNRLKYALTYKDVTTILMQRLVSIDGKIRTDKCYPAGLMGMY
jgi:small subunit ribosomal protein S4e